jgi:hypothetical protein
MYSAGRSSRLMIPREGRSSIHEAIIGSASNAGLLVPSSGYRPSGQDVGDGDPTDLDSINEYGDILAGREVLSRMVTIGVRNGVHLDLAVYEVDDPVGRDPAASIHTGQLAVFAA